MPVRFFLVSPQLAVLWSLLSTRHHPERCLQKKNVRVQLPITIWEVALLSGDVPC
jgi:hypothetical protein